MSGCCDAIASNLRVNSYFFNCFWHWRVNFIHIPRQSELLHCAVTLGDIQWRTFNDGFPNLFVTDALDVRNKHVAFLASFHNPSVIFEQLSIIYALPRLFVSSFTLVLPFFPTGTAERMEVSIRVPLNPAPAGVETGWGSRPTYAGMLWERHVLLEEQFSTRGDDQAPRQRCVTVWMGPSGQPMDF